MAYMTMYSMEISEDVPTINMVAAQLAQMEDPKVWGDNASMDVRVAFWEHVISGHQDATWYEHDRDMRHVSQQWPGITFTLKGRGDEQDDHWVEYHRDGKMQRITRGPWEIPDMDEAQMA